MRNSRHLAAKEAAGELGVSLSTLYAYVSRGLIRSEATGDNKKTRLYHEEDISHLKSRKEARRNPDRIAREALHTGAPVLESAITLITNDCLYYRGHNALSLAINHSLEEVAALIWTGNLNTPLPALAQPAQLSPYCKTICKQITHLNPIEIFQVLLPLAEHEDSTAYDTHPEAVVQTGARILRLLVALAAGNEKKEDPTAYSPEAIVQETGAPIPPLIVDRTAESKPSDTIAQTLQKAWAPDHPQSADLLNTVLILYADHELNASTFTARCAASTGATPYAAVNAGLSALSGPKHGTASQNIEALLREIESQENVRPALIDRLQRGEAIYGFGHAIYTDVDPRARLLFDQIQNVYPDSPHVALTRTIIEETHRLKSFRYNIDLPLVTLARILNFPPGRTPALFALGRTVGWIGHILEQYKTNRLIRPRARYVGPQPST